MFGNKTKKSVQSSIPYKKIYDNGVIETEAGTYTKAYKLDDVNFSVAPNDEQLRMFFRYGSWLNTFDHHIRMQIVIHNHRTDRRSTMDKLRFDSAKDGLNKYRIEMNGLLIDTIAKTRNNLTQDKYVVVSVHDADRAHAMQLLDNIDADIMDKALSSISREAGSTPMSITERLKCLHQFYNQDGESTFENSTDSNGMPVFDLMEHYKHGLSSKDVIAPSALEFQNSYFKVGRTYGRCMFLKTVSSRMTTEFLESLSSLPCSMAISIHYQPLDMTKAVKMIRDQIININAEVVGQQQAAAQNNYSVDNISPTLKRYLEQSSDLMEDITTRDQKMFDVSFYITVFAPTPEILEENTKMVIRVAPLCQISTLVAQQEDAFNATLPLCINKLQVKRMHTTESASVFMPFASQELFQEGGIYYGVNQTTNNLIVYSRQTGNNYNGLIFGASGSGKSFTAKQEMASVRLRHPDNVVYVIDPEGEYGSLVRAMGGQVIELSASSKGYVNPLDMDIDYGGDSDPISMKSDYIISMIEIMMGTGQSLNPKARTIIDRCVKFIYNGYIQYMDRLRDRGSKETCVRDAMPTLDNLYNALVEQPEDEAKAIASILEIYAHGSLSTFSHQTTIDPKAKFVAYDISKMSTGMKNLGLHICLNDIWNNMIANRKKDIWTWFYVDEFYLLLQSPSATSFLMQIWKRARKWRGVPTGIMQNTEDLLSNPEARNIINNTSFITMLDLPKMDRDVLGELLQIPDSQMSFITNANPGHGLVYTGKTLLPFKNEFPKNTELYKLMSTSAKEKI